ncbi:hypothetical protein [Pseudonocardia sp.]|uniref:hypothetical protein n=1 Tax=Pseudonocardia sp. TaxID=60912 RepID=UPI0031FC41DC
MAGLLLGRDRGIVLSHRSARRPASPLWFLRTQREAGTITGTETWTSEECARAWGVKTPTWLGYVSRGQAPQPLDGSDEQGRRHWDADEVRRFPRPGAGRSRSGAGPEAEALLAEMREVADRIEELRARQRELLGAGKRQGLEVLAMSRALGISRQTAYSWLDGG